MPVHGSAPAVEVRAGTAAACIGRLRYNCWEPGTRSSSREKAVVHDRPEFGQFSTTAVEAEDIPLNCRGTSRQAHDTKLLAQRQQLSESFVCQKAGYELTASSRATVRQSGPGFHPQLSPATEGRTGNFCRVYDEHVIPGKNSLPHGSSLCSTWDCFQTLGMRLKTSALTRCAEHIAVAERPTGVQPVP
jgi:hypothetical protein